MDRYAGRRNRVCKAVAKAGADALLVTNFTNVTYLTGFTGEDSYLLLNREGEVLLTDGRYTTQLEQECPGLSLEVRAPGVKMLEAVTKTVKASKLSKLAVEGESMTLGMAERIRDKLPEVTLHTATGTVEELRLIKDKEELAEIRQSIWYAEKGFQVLRATLRRDRTEKEVANDLEHQLRLFGAKGCSFEPIVAVGSRAALPHARPTDVRIGDGDFVLVDWGATGWLYRSDLTRVLVTGKIPPKLERIYGVVLNAQMQAIAAIRPGITCHDVDRVARDAITEAGFGLHFTHGLGHGIGLDIHEGPRLGNNNQQPLAAGMVVTVEPGIYFPGWGGVRIEDDVLVTKSGHEVLTTVPKQFEDTVVT